MKCTSNQKTNVKNKKEVTQNTLSRKQRWGKCNRAIGVKGFGKKKQHQHLDR